MVACCLILPLCFFGTDGEKQAKGSIFRSWCSLAQDMKSHCWDPPRKAQGDNLRKISQQRSQIHISNKILHQQMLFTSDPQVVYSTLRYLIRWVYWFDDTSPFFLIFLFLRPSRCPLHLLIQYVIFQIILCSFIHALCSITNLSE